MYVYNYVMDNYKFENINILNIFIRYYSLIKCIKVYIQLILGFNLLLYCLVKIKMVLYVWYM